jgi:hypothetical protein
MGCTRLAPRCANSSYVLRASRFWRLHTTACERQFAFPLSVRRFEAYLGFPDLEARFVMNVRWGSRWHGPMKALCVRRSL